jgi:Fe-S oxidoreductase
LIPSRWRQHWKHPLFAGRGPETGFFNLADILRLERGAIFLPAPARSGRREAVFYFPGCGAGLFFRSIGLAGLTLLLRAGMGVVVPREHLCCGYPLLVSGCEEAFTTNQARNLFALKKLLDEAKAENIFIRTVLTACGSCRDGLQHYELGISLRESLRHLDLVQYLSEILPVIPADPATKDRPLLYHASCHAEWTGLAAAKAPEEYRRFLASYTDRKTMLSPLCCGESGLGAMTSPNIYEKLRSRKEEQLTKDLVEYNQADPILVGCPSCKVGIMRSLLRMKREQPVLHTVEFLAARLFGEHWEEESVEALTRGIVPGSPVRLVEFGKGK